LWIPEIFALLGLWLFGLELITMLLRLIVGGSSAISGNETK